MIDTAVSPRPIIPFTTNRGSHREAPPRRSLTEFVYGVLAAGYLIAGIFFLRFWWKTRERLLLIFACAFWLLALSQTLLGVTDLHREEQSWIYLIRLCAFILIIAGIISVNLKKH